MKGSINYRLKGAIAESGHTQSSLSKAIDMNEGTLSRKLKGTRPFEEEEMQLICDVLQKKVTDIFF